MERLVDRAAVRNGDNVLDLGCGTAMLGMAVKSRRPGAIVIGLDGDAAVLRIADRNVGRAGCDVTLVHGMSYAMPFASFTFDRVVSSLLFHHLTTTDKRRTLREVRRVLKPSGTLHILDWGEAQNLFMRLAFTLVQLFDGFDTTADNVQGRIPQLMMGAGFDAVSEKERIHTAGGSLSIYSAVNPR